jgi:hypothetical protein
MVLPRNKLHMFPLQLWKQGSQTLVLYHAKPNYRTCINKWVNFNTTTCKENYVVKIEDHHEIYIYIYIP